MTALLDLVVAVGLSVGPAGKALFLLLFSVPFNAVLLVVWWGVAARVLVRGERRLLFGTGIRVLDDGHRVRVRLPRMTPLLVAFLAAFGFPAATVLAMAQATRGEPPVPVAAAALVLNLAAIVAVFAGAARRISAGEADLIIDRLRGTVTLPRTFGRTEPLTVPRADLAGIDVLAVPKADSEGCVTWSYALIGRWRAADGGLREGKLAELTSREVAEHLSAIIGEAVSGRHAGAGGDSA
jgi:hypothetical protein